MTMPICGITIIKISLSTKETLFLFHSPYHFIAQSKINNNGYIHIDSDFDIKSNTV